ncbi:hypothetical protein B0T20DRAFT_4987 [Sordaria brevicollis]|uniref:Uncharacterized protein n=1 Tax=Sordaria brevicollis TaxID=83679 RepID=A0AAE0PMX0_SORBR|nr:hypothetical protein B0T20DRAFT_4987 [Sordaria brevicollis]
MSGLLQAAKGAAGNISRAPKKFNLLIAFDAFETLYAPKEPVHKTYGQFARDNGLKHASDDVVAKYLHNRITTAAKEYPNYGKHIKGMTPEGWWMKVIKNIFTDVEPTLASPSHKPQLDDLGRRLFHHFSTRDAYKTAANMPGLLQSLKHHKPSSNSPIGHVVLGVISNSDDRVSGILSSLGLKVSPLRFQRESKSDPHFASAAPVDGKSYDVDFTVMSYDVEESKPHRVMWQAGEMLARRSVVHELNGKKFEEETPWLKVYVGDDVKKDVESAWGVGWNAVLLKEFVTCEHAGDERLEDLEGVLDKGVVEVLGGPKPRMFAVNKLETLVEWIVKRGLEAPAGLDRSVDTSAKRFKLVDHME